MISEVVMPQMGADMTEGTLIRWLKQEGDAVNRGEIIAEIETDKANVEIEAFESGVFRKTLAQEGDTVQVGEVIAVIAAADDDISKYAGSTNGAATSQNAAPAKQPAAAATAKPEASNGAPTVEATPAQTQPPVPPAPRPPAQQDSNGAAAPAPETGRVRASPLARRVARERGIDLAQVRGSGPDGRIVKSDIEGLAAAPAQAAAQRATVARGPAPTGTTQVTMSRMRQAIARRMSQSKREAPHYYLLIDIDMTEAVALRRQINDTFAEDARVSLNDMLVRACAIALREHPEFNATIEAGAVRQHEAQNICIGIALDEGLIAPAILDVGNRTLVEIAAASKDLIDRAKNGALRADEINAGTFTISNLGAYGVETLVAIIQPPQTAIIGVGAVTDTPVAAEGAVAVRSMMKLALSADHRVTDGAQGARFLSTIKQKLEKPLSLLL